VSEFLKVFETTGGVTVEQLLAFAALVVPGFISLRVYDMRRGGEGRKVNEVLIDVIVYSFATDLIGIAALALISTTVPIPAQPLVKGIAVCLIFLLAPVGFAAVWFDVQKALKRSGVFPDTLTNPWDRMMERVVRERLDLGVILTLKDGRKIGARLGATGDLASDRDGLLLGEVWTIDEAGATLREALPGSCGILVSRADCQTIEFLRWESEPADSVSS
jgi:hypothetical protein